MRLLGLHHTALIATDYPRSKKFYTEILGFRLLREEFRQHNQTWRADLLNGSIQIELFGHPSAPPRPTLPEAAGLRHLAFAVPNLDAAIATLARLGVSSEPVRSDPLTGNRFTFFRDPDNLPLELCEPARPPA
ncbi:MAG: VOC family protein [Opitutaceae bacterium]|jgi:glyoxylase I family protein|nr:VOC family protein [Opitutaceae bacterium]